VPASLALGRLVEHHLYGVKANDTLSLCASAAFIIVMAQAAVLVPVWRALHIDLVSALRYE
jgi:ABC-type lipoprotein release transport system permease subunit